MRVLNRLHRKLFPRGPGTGYYRLLLAFVLMNAFADFTYPVISKMGTVDPTLSPGEAIRGLQLALLVLLAPRLAVSRRDLLFSVTFVLLGVVFFFNYGGTYELAERFIWANKLLYLVLFMALIRTVVRSAPDMADRVGELLVISTFVFMVIPILASFLGVFGYRSYGDRMYRQGFKGFLFSINSVSINLIVAMGLSLGFTRRVLVQSLFVAAAFLVGTKAAAAAGAGVAVLLAVRFTLLKAGGSNPLMRAASLLVFSGLIVTSWPYLQALQAQNWSFYLYRFSQTGSIMSVITSGRWEYIAQFPDHVAQLMPIEWLMGTHRPTFNEIDFTALFTRFGLLGFGWYLAFFGGKIWNAVAIWRGGPKPFAVALTLGILLVHSTLGGHVLGNAVVAYHVATALVLCEHYYSERTAARRDSDATHTTTPQHSLDDPAALALSPPA